MDAGITHEGDTPQVAILCEAEGYPSHGSSCRATVALHFGMVERDHVSARISLTLAEQAFAASAMFYGLDLLHFADGLDRIRSQLEGSARLVDWDSDPV